MFRVQFAWRHSVRSVIIVVWELLQDGLQFMNVIARSRTAVAAEVLFLRKQLAYYQDHNIRPRQADRCGPVVAGALVSPVRLEGSADYCDTGDFHPLASQEFQVVLALQVAGRSATSAKGHSPADCSHVEGKRYLGRGTNCR